MGWGIRLPGEMGLNAPLAQELAKFLGSWVPKVYQVKGWL
jgi:hypothetical protein